MTTTVTHSNFRWIVQILRQERGLSADEALQIIDQDPLIEERLKDDINRVKKEALQHELDRADLAYRQSPEGRLQEAKRLISLEAAEAQTRRDAILLLTTEQGLDQAMLADQSTKMLVEASGLALSDRPEINDPDGNDWAKNVAALERSDAHKKP